MPFEVVNESCTMESGKEGSAMIYKIEGDERVPFACHENAATAYGVIALIEEAEGKTTDTMAEHDMEEMQEELQVEEKQFESGDLIHWVDEEDDGFGRVTLP